MTLKKSLIVGFGGAIGIVVLPVLLLILAFGVASGLNNLRLMDIHRQLQTHELPPDSQLVERNSWVGKKGGNGSGCMFGTTVTLQTETELRDLYAFYDATDFQSFRGNTSLLMINEAGMLEDGSRLVRVLLGGQVNFELPLDTRCSW